MEQIQLKASLREGKGKQAAKRLRREGFVPATVYHRGDTPLSVSLPDKEITRIVRSHGGENILINLTIEKDKRTKPRAVIIKEIQQHPVKQNILHVDLNEISLSEKITVEVSIVALGEPVGVKQDGGLLDHPTRELKITCLPTDIPKHIDVDVSGLKINDTIHVRDLVLSDKLKVLNDPDQLLFQVKLHEEEVEATTAEPQEVEVIREKKEEEGAAGGAGEKAEKKDESKAKEAAKPSEKK